MLTRESSNAAHILQNAALILLSLAFLPLDTFILCCSWLLAPWLPSPSLRRRHIRSTAGFQSRTVLITGVGMTKGLALARIFFESGHRVVGADFEPNGALVCGRVSRSVDKFYSLTRPSQKHGSAHYVFDLLRIIEKEKVDIWVSCSGVANAVEDGEAKEAVERHTGCKAVQFDVTTTETLHEKHSFITHTHSLGLTVPETHIIIDSGSAQAILLTSGSGSATDKKFIMKCVGLDDSSRGDMTLLPRSTPTDTYKHLSRLDISPQNPWILQQYIHGAEYCTHSLVIRGQVVAFVACPSAELLMHYESLPADSVLSKAMLKFTQTFAADGGETFTGHLSFDFLVEDATQQDPSKIVLYPIECNPRAHTAVALFNGTPGLVDAYLSLLAPTSPLDHKPVLVVPKSRAKYYWIGHDLVTLVLLRILNLLTGSGTLIACIDGIQELADYILFWKDGTYELWDPLPWWWLYHVYWPVQFFNSIVRGRKWSRINVSTTKMFAC